jgi:hypothetical protein
MVMHRKCCAAAALAAAAFVLARAGAPSLGVAQTYQGTPTPAIAGTRTPEQNPATSVQAPAISAPNATAPGPVIGGGTSAPAPGLSFGAAPAPIVSPNR